MRTDYYQTLGVLDSAEDVVIRAAYRALAQRYHPDKAKGANGDPKALSLRMAAIQEAYEVLSDPVRRAKYDLGRFTPKTPDFPAEMGFPSTIGNIEAQAWDILQRFYPHLGSNLALLEKNKAHLAATYRSMLMEFISEKLVSRLVNNICQEIKDVVDEDQPLGTPTLNKKSEQSKPHLK